MSNDEFTKIIHKDLTETTESEIVYSDMPELDEKWLTNMRFVFPKKKKILSLLIDLLRDVEEKYQTLSKSFDFGATPDKKYAEELMAVYNETFSKNEFPKIAI